MRMLPRQIGSPQLTIQDPLFLIKNSKFNMFFY